MNQCSTVTTKFQTAKDQFETRYADLKLLLEIVMEEYKKKQKTVLGKQNFWVTDLATATFWSFVSSIF
jgi:hypothetical protein